MTEQITISAQELLEDVLKGTHENVHGNYEGIKERILDGRYAGLVLTFPSEEVMASVRGQIVQNLTLQSDPGLPKKPGTLAFDGSEGWKFIKQNETPARDRSITDPQLPAVQVSVARDEELM